ncbi:MAG: MBL fold metallo-hydrolase [bacterium]|nr:MBL fold metallo-hydrolase [bacterium]
MQKIVILSIGIVCLLLSSSVFAVTVLWYGQSSFVITGEKGFRVVTDPYKPGGFDGAIGYKPITVSADVVTVSHEHADHNYVEQIGGNPTVLRSPGKQKVKEVEIIGIESFHDKMFGVQRGKNTIFKFAIDSITFCHLGDLGTTLSKSQIEQLGKINILMIPVGGTYTIDWQDAWKVIDQLKPNIVIPMHYKTDAVKFPLATVAEFLSKGGTEKVDQTTVSKLEISKDKLPKPTQIIVMQYLQ